MLKFLGRGSAFNSKEGNNCAYFKSDDVLILFDCGSNIFEKIIKNNVLDGIKRVLVMITHTHTDHIGSLGTLIEYIHYILKIEIDVCSMGKLVKQILTLSNVDNKIYNYYDSSIDNNLEGLLPHMSIKNNIIIMKFIKTKHVGENCYGILVSTENVTIQRELLQKYSFYYSGDSSEIPPNIIKEFLEGDIDHIYQDISTNDYTGNVHLSYKKLCEQIPHEFRKKVSIMHIDQHFDIDKAKVEGFNVVDKEFE